MVKVRENIAGWKMWEHGVPDSRLTVIEQADDYVSPTTGRRFARWICECNCGEHNKVISVTSSIKSGDVKSCGCLLRELASQRSLVDMTGWKMSEHGVPDSLLTVIKRVGTGKDGHALWECECGCDEHNRFVAFGHSIRDGSTKSCGCLNTGYMDMTDWIMSEHGVPDSRLTVRKIVDYYTNGSYKEPIWQCDCACGGECVSRASSIRSGSVKSCGCLHKDKMHENFIDMTGWVMKAHGVLESRLTVLYRTDDYVNPTTGDSTAKWHCVCECGNECDSIGSRIRDGSILSCGCLRTEKTRERGFENKKYNDYEILGDVVRGKFSATEGFFLIDIDDYYKLNHYCWNIDKSGYVVATDTESGKTVKMHQLIAGKHCDHINRDKTDNRRANLRKATETENKRNHKKRKDNTSGFTGVGFLRGKWTASISDGHGKAIYLGVFTDKEDAIRVRLKAEAERYGDFAPQRHLFEQYGIVNNL